MFFYKLIIKEDVLLIKNHIYVMIWMVNTTILQKKSFMCIIITVVKIMIFELSKITKKNHILIYPFQKMWLFYIIGITYL